MADTVFNIFDSHIGDPVQSNVLPRALSENVNAVKKLGAIPKGLTPSKINKNILTLRSTDPNKVVMNIGGSMQLFQSVYHNKEKKIEHTPFKKPLQVYVDETINKKTYNEAEELIKMEFNRKPPVNDDSFDEEFSLTNTQMNNLVFGLPSNFTPVPSFKKQNTIKPEIDDIPIYSDAFDDFPEPDDFQIDDSELLII